MKVLDLRCAHGHGFEGWFASEDDFTQQKSQGLVECPMCGDQAIARLPSAPRLNLSGAREAPQASMAVKPNEGDMQAAWLGAVRRLMANTEDVGPRFAEEARRIHYGETPQRGIRGQATREERESLQEEGIETMSIPVPRVLDGPVQ